MTTETKTYKNYGHKTASELRDAVRKAANAPELPEDMAAAGDGWTTVRVRRELAQILLMIAALEIIKTGKRPTASETIFELIVNSLPQIIPNIDPVVVERLR